MRNIKKILLNFTVNIIEMKMYLCNFLYLKTEDKLPTLHFPMDCSRHTIWKFSVEKKTFITRLIFTKPQEANVDASRRVGLKAEYYPIDLWIIQNWYSKKIWSNNKTMLWSFKRRKKIFDAQSIHPQKVFKLEWLYWITRKNFNKFEHNNGPIII